MVGILTEKMSACRNFAKALGGQKGSYNGENYVITSSVGHLYEFASPDKQVNAGLSAKYKSWSLSNLPWNENDFSWKREAKKDTSSVVASIRSVLSKCDEIVIATDVDPTGEGELLAWEIIDELGLHNKKFSRMYFIDESVSEIRKAFVNRKSIPSMQQDMDFVKAYYRSKWDFMSMQFTRIATNYGDGKSVLRQGRLKSAMVLITGQGLDAVKVYKKIPFYQNRFKDENGNIFSNPDEPLFPDKSQVPQTYAESAVIVDSKDNKSSSPPKLLDLAALSSRLSSKGIKAKDVLNVYQKMYESQIVSYPRTEDKTITPEQFNELLPLIDKIAGVVGVDTKILTHRAPRKTHVKTGGAHGANRPGVNVPNSLDDLKQYGTCAPLIYEILARNYLATVAEDYEYEQQKGHLKKYPDFKGTANIPKKMGYKAVFSDDDSDDDIGDSTGKGLGTKASPYIHEGFPPKPPQPTMKWLMKQLEKNDVGTGATRTSTFAEVTNEKTKFPLMIEKKGKLSLSECGDMSYLLLKDTHIGDLKITEQIMSDMRDIAAGKANPDDCLHRLQQLVIEDMETMKRNSVTMRQALNITVQKSQPKEKYKGIWSVTGQTIEFSREWNGHRFTDDECKKLLNGEEIDVMGFKGSDGGEYGVHGKLSEQVVNKHKYIGFEKLSFISTGPQTERCKGMWNGKEISFKREWAGHHFTDSECKSLLNGEEIEIELKNADGKEYTVKGKLAEQKYNGKKYVGFSKIDSGSSNGERVSGTWKGKKVSFKREYRGYRFSDSECKDLLAGKEISIFGLVSKSSGKAYGVRGKLSEQTYNGHKFVGFEQSGFANQNPDAVPKQWCKHVFTDDEIAMLEAGKTVFVEGCVSKKNTVFSTRIKFDTREDGTKGIVIVKGR